MLLYFLNNQANILKKNLYCSKYELFYVDCCNYTQILKMTLKNWDKPSFFQIWVNVRINIHHGLRLSYKVA